MTVHWPFRIRYWVIRHNPMKRIVVIRQRFKPWTSEFEYSGVICLDGPFDSQEDAARSLAFWRAQYERSRQPQPDELE